MKASRDKFYSDFDPRVPAGCALWLDGADSNAMTLSGSNVSVWRDKSGMSNNASQATTSNQPTFNGSGIVFDGISNFLQIANPSIRPTNAFVVVESSAASGHIYRKGHANSGSNDLETFLRYNSSNIDTYYINSSGTQSNVTYTSGATASKTLIESTWDDTTIRLYTNGTERGSNTLTGPQRTATTGATDMRIGAEFSSSSNTSAPAGLWNGTIYEIIMYSNALTPSNRQAVEGYLARKWGIQSSLPATHAYIEETPFMRPMIPPDLGNSENWFDAADIDTITASAGIVSSWKNKGVICGEYNATVYSGNPTTSIASQNGLNCIGLASTDILQHQDVAVDFTTQPRSHFFASRPTLDTTIPGPGTVAFKFQGGINASGNDAILFYNNGRLLELAQGVAFQIETDSIPNQQNIFGVYTFVNAATTTNNRIALDGSSIPLITNSVAANYNQTTPLTDYINLTVILGSGGNVGSQDIGEWVGFRSELSPANVQKMEGYLAWKWGNRASMPAAHPYRNFQPLALAFNPRMFGTCALWLDALDASSIKVTSGAVETWYDKSGNNRHITQSSAGNRPTYVATNLQDPYVQFVGSSSQYIDLSDADGLAVGRSFSAFFVEDRALGGQNYFIGGQSSFPSNTTLILGYTGDTSVFMQFISNALAYSSLPSFGSDQSTRVWNFAYTKPGREIRANGTLLTTDTNADDLASWSGASLGRTFTDYYTGSIREILWYTPALTSNERSMVEGYLAHKWNRKEAFSFGHPYKKVIP